MNNSRIVIALIFMVGLCLPSSATNPSVTRPQAANLGKVHFANSCSSQVQVEFNNAVAMLHSFQYGLAEKTFNHVLEKDPRCAIAYWGAAMTLYHQLWDAPGAETLKQGRDYLAKATQLPKSPRELAYLKAAEAFFQPEQQLRGKSRMQAYSYAMRNLHRSYPEDSDATAFYALSLLTLPADDGLTYQRRAITLLTKLFAAQPEHPGAAHYLIHATVQRNLHPWVSLPPAATRKLLLLLLTLSTWQRTSLPAWECGRNRFNRILRLLPSRRKPRNWDVMMDQAMHCTP